MRKTIKKVTQKYHDSVVEGLTQTIDRLTAERDAATNNADSFKSDLSIQAQSKERLQDRVREQALNISALEGRLKERDDTDYKAITIALNVLSSVAADEDRVTVLQRAIGSSQAALSVIAKEGTFKSVLYTYENRDLMYATHVKVKSDVGYVGDACNYSAEPYKNKIGIRAGKY